jgi:oxygen-independent coproporphyrinogen-3 oxidase
VRETHAERLVYSAVPARHLYVHVPFCSRRCSYCDFSIAVRRVVPVADYMRGIEIELGRRTDVESELDTLYLGGGTPSRLGPEGIRRLFDLILSRHSLAPRAEVTIEANPEDVTAAAVRAWAEAGVNRVSVGLQSFDDRVLAWMHRVHDSAQARAAVDIIRAGGIENFSVDLIFSLPEEVVRDWGRDLDQALDLTPPHISLYGLTFEEATPLARWASRGDATEGTDERYAAEFLLADSKAASRGYRHYEVSNFAKPGFEARHNSSYWKGVPYAGIGPSAHSFDGQARSWNVKAYAEWLERLTNGATIVSASETLDEGNRASEKVYLGLRTDAGLRSGAHDLGIAGRWEQQGWARIENDVIRLTPEGWLRLDSLAAGLTGF